MAYHIAATVVCGGPVPLFTLAQAGEEEEHMDSVMGDMSAEDAEEEQEYLYRCMGDEDEYG